MTIHYPLATQPGSAPPPSKNTAPAAILAPGSWRYEGRQRSRTLIVAGALVSASIHLAVIYGFRHAAKVPVVAPKEEFMIRLTPMPEIKDLDEPDPTPSDEAPPETATLVPMQQDLPQLPQPSDFVQKVNFD